MNNPLVFAFLLIVSGAAALLGGYYYLRPEKVVLRRVSKEHTEAAQKDPEYRKWLDSEIQIQAKRTRQLGLTILIFEAIWMVLIFGVWQSSINH